MDFARKQLEKYGWTEGKGLGRQEDGMSSALRPKLKFDKAGVGHDPGKEFTNDWWNNIYNNAINNIDVQKDDGKISISRVTSEPVKITNKYSSHTKQSNSMYGNFIKTEKLMSDGIVSVKMDDVQVPSTTTNFTKLSDEELFAACGGRTAHKGARHGLKLSGKLSRIAKQERLLLKKLQKVTIDEEALIKKKMKKLSDNKEIQLKQSDESMVDDYDSRSSTGSVTPKKKCKKKKKSVSFKDVVTEYTTHESTSPETEEQALLTTVKESVIHDCDDQTSNNSAEKVGRQINDIRVQMESFAKKKKKDTATFRFLESMRNEMNLSVDNSTDVNTDTKRTKRKLIDNDDESKIPVSLRYLKQRKKKKRQESHINNIADNLVQMCKISDSESGVD